MSPLLIEIVNLVVFVIGASFLSGRFGMTGLVAVRSSTFFMVMGILMVILARRDLLKLRGAGSFLLRAFAATAALGIVNWFIWRMAQPLFDSGNTLLKLVITLLGLTISGGVYLGAALLLRLGEARQIIRTVRDLVPGLGGGAVK